MGSVQYSERFVFCLQQQTVWFSKLSRVTNIFQFFPYRPWSRRYRVLLHYEKDPMGAAIIVRCSKHPDLSFASIQRTKFSLRSRSVVQMEQMFNKTFAVLNGPLVLSIVKRMVTKVISELTFIVKLENFPETSPGVFIS